MFGWFKKGDVMIEIPSNTYSYGDTVEGNVTLKLKKPLDARGFKVRIYAKRRTKSMKPGNNRTEYTNVFDSVQILDSNKNFGTEEKTYSFKIKLPKNFVHNQVTSSIIKSVQLLSGNTERTYWYLQAYLDIPMGIDVSTTIPLNVN